MAKKTQKLQSKLDILRKYGVKSATPIVVLQDEDGAKVNVINGINYSELELEDVAKSRNKTKEEFLDLIDKEVNASIKGDDETPIVPLSEPQLDTIDSDAVGGKEADPNAVQEEEEAKEKALAKEEKNAQEQPPVEEEAQPAPVVIEETQIEKLQEPEPKKQAPKTVAKKTTNKK